MEKIHENLKLLGKAVETNPENLKCLSCFYESCISVFMYLLLYLLFYLVIETISTIGVTPMDLRIVIKNCNQYMFAARMGYTNGLHKRLLEM